MRAAALLCLAKMLVALVPLRMWRSSLGPGTTGQRRAGDLPRARQEAHHVMRAASRLPFSVKCLPQAMALSWILRRAQIPHAVAIAARPPGQRDGEDALHAWVDVMECKVVGDLPGPWHVVFRTP